VCSRRGNPGQPYWEQKNIIAARENVPTAYLKQRERQKYRDTEEKRAENPPAAGKNLQRKKEKLGRKRETRRHREGNPLEGRDYRMTGGGNLRLRSRKGREGKEAEKGATTRRLPRSFVGATRRNKLNKR